jgi:hypothetical protein
VITGEEAIAGAQAVKNLARAEREQLAATAEPEAAVTAAWHPGGLGKAVVWSPRRAPSCRRRYAVE